MGFRGLSAVHYVAEDSGSSDANGNSVSNSADGVFRRWSPARWARRTGAEGGAFSLDAAQGTVAVGEAGIYLVYVQVRSFLPAAKPTGTRTVRVIVVDGFLEGGGKQFAFNLWVNYAIPFLSLIIFFRMGSIAP